MKDKLSNYMEKLLVISLSGLAITIFIGWKDVGPFLAFDLVSLGLLLAWRYALKYHPYNPVPRQVFVASLLFIASIIVSALMSENRHFAFVLLKQYKIIILGGLLFTAPINDQYRKYIITIFFLAAAAAGLIGILQYFGIMQMANNRPDGFSNNPNLYAGALSIACGSAIVMLFLPKTHLFASRKGFSLIIGVAIMTLCGVLLSQSRGIWLAVIAACTITLFIHDRRRALVFIFVIVISTILIFLNSKDLKERALSIITLIYTDNETGSFGNRVELWKGSLLIFKEHPVLGTGLGDFDPEIQNLILYKKIKNIPTIYHAHNIYFQALATRGAIGLTILFLFLMSLLRWGRKLIQDHDALGGYIIIFVTLLAMIGGLTDNHLEFSRFLSASCFTIGLFGPYGLTKGCFKN